VVADGSEEEEEEEEGAEAVVVGVVRVCGVVSELVVVDAEALLLVTD